MAKAPAKKKAVKKTARKASKSAPPARNIKVTAPGRQGHHARRADAGHR